MPKRDRRGRLPGDAAGPDDDGPEQPEPIARPRERFEVDEDDDERLVPIANVGGAAPTPHGGDSGGDEPGEGDVLSNLAEPEPPVEPPEVGAVHVRQRDLARPRPKK